MEEKLCALLNKSKKPISFDTICEKLSIISQDARKELKNLLDKYEKSFLIYETPNSNYTLMSKTSFKVGEFYSNSNKGGKVVVIENYEDAEGNNLTKKEEYFVDKSNCLNAVNGDEVIIDLKYDKNTHNNTAVINKVIKRNIKYIGGEVIKAGNKYYVKPKDKRYQDLIIELDGISIEGALVLCAIEPTGVGNNYIGHIDKIYGYKDDPDTEKDKLIIDEALKYGIFNRFSDESLEQVENLPQEVKEEDKNGRYDFTNWEVYTIDGADTKDMDDALSCKVLSNGNYLVGVHIADINHYVPIDSPLALDAYQKGNSAYLGGKVFPMFPHELSNGICSLNPGVERLAVSCIMEITPKGRVIRSDFYESVIKSRKKMTYDAVNKILMEDTVPKGYEPYVESLKNLNSLAKRLRANRIKNGSIEFDRGELRAKLDSKGNLIDIVEEVQKDGEKLIEEFMLIANETVDKILCDCNYPVVHRVHDAPSEERLDDFLKLLSAIGKPFEGKNASDCCNKEVLQELIEHVKKIENLNDPLNVDLIRCMSRAKYVGSSRNNKDNKNNHKHFCLGFDNYCHSTAPIRRYVDYVIQWLLINLYIRKKSPYNLNKLENNIGKIAVHCSNTEKLADTAEMEVDKLRCAEYMYKYIGKDFDAIIVGISDHGIQVQLPNGIEGRIIPQNYHSTYKYFAKSHYLYMEDAKTKYYLGDVINVKLIKSDPKDKTINFSINKKVKENNYVGNDNLRNKRNKSKVKTRRGTYH